ncbi:MAG: UDP-N-acetylmuramoyl-tripeptide--D-alanyl-D-alanine ligase, partial [Pseudomonadota bacterium]
MDLSLTEIASITNGQLIGEELHVTGVSTDTRNMDEGELFVALIGESFDPHGLIENDQAKKASAVLVQREVKTSTPQIIVKDCYKGLQDISAAWRKKFRIPVVGITGSNGKTSVKELIKQILATQGNVLATQGNLNNHIGVPLTLCSLSAENDYAVIEMGANHAGEIACLAKLAQPNIGVITNIGPAHLEGFGSIDGVARAKAELYANLNQSGVAVVNADDAYRGTWKDEIGDRMQISFGIEKPADVSGKQIAGDLVEITTPMGEMRVKPQITGMHAVLNILAATTVGLAIGVDLEDIRTGIENTQVVQGRLMRVTGLAGATVLDDTYNANPASLAAALDVQAQEPGEHWLVLGDMG